ncbi:MAG: hypothetical protein IPP80_14410 [Ignavibacteria bacterium]|nr:hypothetical protein [Ignavibacteria bacterium]
MVLHYPALVLALIDVSVGATTILHDVDRVRRIAALLLWVSSTERSL